MKSNIQEDLDLMQHCHENLKSQNVCGFVYGGFVFVW